MTDTVIQLNLHWQTSLFLLLLLGGREAIFTSIESRCWRYWPFTSNTRCRASESTSWPWRPRSALGDFERGGRRVGTVGLATATLEKQRRKERGRKIFIVFESKREVVAHSLARESKIMGTISWEQDENTLFCTKLSEGKPVRLRTQPWSMILLGAR